MAKLSSSLLRKLKDSSKVWRRSKAAPAMGTDLPDGSYLGKCISLTVNESKASGRVQISERWKVVEPAKHKGRFLFNHIGIDGKDDEEKERAFGFAKQRYEEVMDGNLPERDLTEVQDALDNLVDKSHRTVWKLGVKTKDNFQNVYLNGVAEVGDSIDDDDNDDKKRTEDDDDDKKRDENEDDDDKKEKRTTDDDEDAAEEEEYQRERRRKEREKKRDR